MNAKRGISSRLMAMSALIASFAVAFAPRAAAQAVEEPRDLAFNDGIYSSAAVEAAVNDGVAEVLTPTNSTTVIRHIWIETFETDRSTSTLVTSVFESAESTFTATLGGGSTLTGLDILYVLLDYRGQPVGAPSRLTFRLSGGNWTRNLTTLSGRDAFEKLLTPFALKHLRIASGQLDRYPGHPLTPYDVDLQTSKLGRLVGAILAPISVAVAPEAFLVGLIAAAVTDGLKDSFKSFTVEKIRENLVNGQARWGRADRPRSVALRTGQKADEYLSFGTELWPGFGVNLDGAWESQDDDARFRLEISGGRATWIERSRDASERELLRRMAITLDRNSGRFTLVRPVDEGLARFQFPTSFATVMAANPPPRTTLSFTASAAGLAGEYVGIRISAGAVVSGTPSPYSFKKVTE